MKVWAVNYGYKRLLFIENSSNFQLSILFLLFCTMYLVTTPWWMRWMVGKTLTWEIATTEKEIYLTFDDGPHPIATPFVLECLRRFNAKATFFCIGKNVEQNPALYRQIIDEGHRVGNHSFNHLNGWKTNDKEYIDNITKAKDIIDSKLFRPPYGRISTFQIKQLKPFYSIIMWNVLSGDFDISLSKERCLDNVLKHTSNGSIIVFHDSEKAFERLEYALPMALKYFQEKGFKMSTLK